MPKAKNWQYEYDRLRTSIGGWALAAVLVVSGFLVLWWGDSLSADHHARLKSFLLAAGGVVAATGLLSVGWELSGKRSLLREAFAVATLGQQIETSGLRGISTTYLDAADWDKLIRSSRDIDLAVAWAHTWRESHKTAWLDWAKSGRGTAHVLLPDLENVAVVEEVARKFNLEQRLVTENISRAMREFSAIGRVEIRYTDVPLVWTFYGFTAEVVVTMHTISKAKMHNVPTLVLDPDGSVGEFFLSQFASAWASARIPAEA